MAQTLPVPAERAVAHHLRGRIPRALLGDMAAKEALSYLRTERRRLRTASDEDAEDVADTRQNPERDLNRAERSEIIEAALAEMDPDGVILLRRIDFDGEAPIDVATSLGRTRDAVQSQLQRARDELVRRVVRQCEKADPGGDL